MCQDAYLSQEEPGTRRAEEVDIHDSIERPEPSDQAAGPIDGCRAGERKQGQAEGALGRMQVWVMEDGVSEYTVWAGPKRKRLEEVQHYNQGWGLREVRPAACSDYGRWGLGSRHAHVRRACLSASTRDWVRWCSIVSPRTADMSRPHARLTYMHSRSSGGRHHSSYRNLGVRSLAFHVYQTNMFIPA